MTPEVLEGEWPGHLVLIEIPDIARARAWYASDIYQAILPLRARSADGSAILLDGVAADYRAFRLLDAMGLS